jgi:alpha-amylase
MLLMTCCATEADAPPRPSQKGAGVPGFDRADSGSPSSVASDSGARESSGLDGAASGVNATGNGGRESGVVDFATRDSSAIEANTPRASDAEAAFLDAGASDATGPASDAAACLPAPVDEATGVMMQAFYWDPVPPASGSWWAMLTARACALRMAGITAIWVPPPYKGTGPTDMGYGVFDRYDLGEFNQKGGTATRWGTRAELETMVTAMHVAGVRVYADVVLNQMLGGDNETFTGGPAPTHFDFSARLNVDPSHPYFWDHTKFSGCMTGAGTFVTWNTPAWDFDATYTNDPMSATYAALGMWDGLLGCEIRYTVQTNQEELIAWGKWLMDTFRFDGFRLDGAKHIYPPFTVRWLSEVRGSRLSIAEFFDGNPDHLPAFVDLLGRQSRVFDFALQNMFHRMSAGGGAFDMRNLRAPGVSDGGARFVAEHGDFAVTFVDNHDTDRDANLRVDNFKILAYAYILTRAGGYPSIFYKDYYEAGLGGAIDNLMAIRSAHAIGAAYESTESDANVYVYGRVGDATHTGMLLLLNDGAASTKSLASSPFLNKQMRDESGMHTQLVATDAQGGGSFPVSAGNYAAWVPTN